MDKDQEIVNAQEQEQIEKKEKAIAPETLAKPSRKKFPWKIIVIITVLLGLSAGGWFLLKEPKFEEEVQQGISLSKPANNELTPTPEPTLEPANKEKVRIEILNGTGIAKEASYLQGKLRSLGYTEIKVGNAGTQKYETAKVTFSKSLADEIVDEITSQLKDIYNNVDVKVSSSLQDFDVKIITGLRSGQTLPTPEPTATPTPKTTPTPTASPSATPTP